MIHLIYCLRRQPHLTRAAFQHHWLHTHGPLVRGFAGLLNIRRYVQRHTLDDPFNETLRKGGAFPEPYDGIAETWFDSVEALKAPLGTPEGKAAMKAIRIDEAGFIDGARSPRWICEEHLLAGD